MTRFEGQGRPKAMEGRMCALTGVAVVVGLTGSAGCHQQIVQPDPERVALTVVNVNNPCTRVAFSITGNNSVTATMPGSSCGESPFKIISGGTMTWKQHPNRLLTIPVRILNKDEVSIPAYYVPRIVLRPAAKVVSNPAGTSPATMVPLNPDSTRADGTVVWLMSLPDSVFVELPGAFPPGSTTHSKTLEFRINSPTIAGVFEFDLVGERFEVADSVPAVAPDSTPAWFAHDSSWTSSLTLKRIAEVEFLVGTTISQRQAAIDSVGGVVVGGYHLPGDPEGTYYVLITSATDESALLAALQKLRRQPGVKNTGFKLRLKPTGLRPLDGTGWLKSNWTFEADASSGDNWNFEELAFPLAWGCQNRVDSTRVGVLEKRITSGEFFQNARPFSISIPLTAPGPFEERHGENVANLVAARGNDGIGITGALWTASIDIVTEASTFATPLTDLPLDRALDSLVRLGVSVINLSQGPGRGITPDLDSAIQHRFADRIATGIEANDPPDGVLLVLAAGNDRDTVAKRAVGILRAMRPANTILVGGSGPRSGTQRDRWGGALFSTALDQGSNWGPLIDVYSPSTEISVLMTGGALGVASGTSYGAPLITGIAALLKEFDRTLTPAAIKTLILQGAAAGGRNMLNDPTKYLANAYESLRLAAKTSNVPLCGNRVWVQNLRSIVVDRGTSTQTIQAFPSPDTIGFVFVRHGGRRLDVQILQQGGPFTGINWNPGGWTTTAATSLPDSLWSGTTWSFFRKTHDGDSVVGPSVTSFGGTAGASSASFVVTLGTSSQSGRTLANMSIPLIAPTFVSGRRNAQVDSAGNFIQYVESTAPADQIFNSSFETGIVRTVPSPFGDRVLVAFSYRDNPVGPPTAWAPGAFATPIGSEWSYQERFAQYNTVSGKTKVWSIPWGGGTPQPLWERLGRTVGWVGLSEAPFLGGHEMVMGIGQFDGATAPLGSGGYTTCRVEYVNLLTGDSLRTPRTVPPATCGFGLVETGTIAPVRAAANQRRRN